MVAVISEDEAVAQTRALNAIEQMLRLVAMSRGHRDPARWLEDALLEMRYGVFPVTPPEHQHLVLPVALATAPA